MSHPVVQRKITSKWFFNSCVFSLFKCRGCNFCLQGSLSQNSENKRRHGAQRDRGSCLVKPPQLCRWILTEMFTNKLMFVSHLLPDSLTNHLMFAIVNAPCPQEGCSSLQAERRQGSVNRFRLTSSTCDLDCKFNNKWNTVGKRIFVFSSSSETLE